MLDPIFTQRVTHVLYAITCHASQYSRHQARVPLARTLKRLATWGRPVSDSQH